MLKLKCPKHPRYAGDKPPKASCGYCGLIERAAVEAGQLEQVLRRIAERRLRGEIPKGADRIYPLKEGEMP